jgi:hypothetical protein
MGREGSFFVAASVQQPTELLHSITLKLFRRSSRAENYYCSHPTEIRRGNENLSMWWWLLTTEPFVALENKSRSMRKILRFLFRSAFLGQNLWIFVLKLWSYWRKEAKSGCHFEAGTQADVSTIGSPHNSETQYRSFYSEVTILNITTIHSEANTLFTASSEGRCELFVVWSHSISDIINS